MARSAGLAVLAGACSGSIGAGPAPEGKADGDGPPGAVTPGATATGTPPAIPTTPGATLTKPAGLDGGRVTMRRLNRFEYNNTVRDLLGTALRPADRFPADEIDHGFDTGAALSFSPLHAELAETAATQLVDELLLLPAADTRRTRVLPCPGADEACLRQVVTTFGRRAFRRPVAAEEVTRLLALGAKVRTETTRPEDGLRAVLTAILVSPHFLFRIERDPDPRSTAPRVVSDHELAARLSYLLWSSTPDEALLAAADAGKLLKDPGEVPRQVTRLLMDGRSGAFTESLAGQWLFGRAMDTVEPQRALFKTFDDKLRAAMRAETERFFDALVDEDRPITDLLLADFTFVDDRLSRHYGLPAAGPEMKRTTLAGSTRGGILGQGTFLTVTSQPDRTSPVKRGVWVLDQLLCSPPPPAPPNVEGLDAPKPGDGATLRQRLEQHRSAPACAGCHQVMDPIGLALEPFDAVGAARTTDNGLPIDASGELPDGTKVSGPRQLATALARDPRVPVCASIQLLTYALGRSFHHAGAHAYAEEITARAGGGKATWRGLLDAVVASEAFRTRRAEAQ